MSNLKLPFCILIGLFANLQAHHIDRVWTDDQGRKTKAVLLNVGDGKALLLMPDGREIPFPLEKLSKIDQAFIKKFGLDTHEEEETTEPDEVLNFDEEWPDRVTYKGDPEINIIEENSDTETFIYESANYRYHSDVRLSTSVVRGFATLFEATEQFVRALPLAVNGGRKTDGKYQIFLFETREAYIEAGGLPGSGGVYIGGQNVVMVPLTSLGVRKVGSGYMLDRSKSSKTLPHELAHQLTPDPYYASGARGWFSEGLAEYVAITPYRSGSFNVRTNIRPILKYVTAYGENNMSGHALGDEIQMGPIEEFFKRPISDFLKTAQISYGGSLLLATYFFHLDGEGDAARIKKFLQALRSGKTDQEALGVLLAGSTYRELEKQISDAYSSKGIDLIFTPEP